jgi:hypothetical protein
VTHEFELDEGMTPFPVDMDESGSGEERDGVLAESLVVVRDLILQGNPDVVPELVRGETLAELMESVGPARAAFRKVAEAVRSVANAAPVVPAGGVGPERIEGPGDVLIKRAIEARRR